MEVKFGKIKTTNNIFVKPLDEPSGSNFFESKSNSQNGKQQQQTSNTRINDYDSNILENNAYQTMPDEAFKLEHKIGMQEQLLAKINTEIETLESLGHDIQLHGLKEQKQKVEQELAQLNKKYAEFGFTTKISAQIASVMKPKTKTNISVKIKKFITKNFLSKMSKKIGQSQTIKEALDSLYGINSSVDELIKMQVPHGETVNRYDKLTAYLNKANKLHAQINRNVDSITKKKVG